MASSQTQKSHLVANLCNSESYMILVTQLQDVLCLADISFRDTIRQPPVYPEDTPRNNFFSPASELCV